MKLNTKKMLKEGLMAELEILAQESQTYQEFEKKFIDAYSRGVTLTQEEKEFLQLIYTDTEKVQEVKEIEMLEAFAIPVDRAVITMIYEIASDYGVQNLPKKQWTSTTKLVRYLVEKVNKNQRIEFVKTIKSIRESMGAEEYIINL